MRSIHEGTKTKILVVGADDMPGGVSGYVNDLISLCDSEKYSFHMTVTGKRLQGSQLNVNIVRHVMPATYSFISFLGLVFHLRTIIRAEGIDIVHLHTARAGMLGCLAALFLPVTVIFTGHSWRHEQKEKTLQKIIFYFYEMLICRLSDYVTFCTNYDLNVGLRKKLVNKDKCHVIKTRIDPSPISDVPVPNVLALKEQMNIPLDAKIIGSIAYMTERKDPLTFIRTASRVLAANLDCYFVWVGDGELKSSAIELSKELNISDKVIITGLVSPEKVPLYLRLFDIFLFTSHFEGVPLSVMSAQAAGLPVVCSKYVGSGVDELIEDGVTGLLFEPGDYIKASELINNIIANPDSITSILLNMNKIYRERHSSPKDMALQYEKIYDLGMSRNSKRRL